MLKDFIESTSVKGGGDVPEAADEALLVALENLNWSSNSRARIIFWLLDAPPHLDKVSIDRMNEVIRLAAKMGVKIVPVGCSGITKSTEFLCRTVALATNGTYTFLTNHSGVGQSHIEPSTDGYKVESFRDILVRISKLMSITPDCNEFISAEQIDQIDTNLTITNPYGLDDQTKLNRNAIQFNLEIEIAVFPNPTNGEIHIKHTDLIKELFIADINGKLLEKIEFTDEREHLCDLSKYTNGIYFLQYYDGIKWNSTKVILQK